MLEFLVTALYAAGLGNVLYFALKQAYDIRLHSIIEYGRVIHEFDPYFNYRATEYLWQHGWEAFKRWFDYMSWYPLGRPVGTTIYPGMQATSVLIKSFILPEWSINDICCLVPAWFGVLATMATALLAYECSVGSFTTITSTTTTTSNQSKTDTLKQQPQPFSTILNDVPIIQQIHQLILRPIIQIFLQKVQLFTGSTNILLQYNQSSPSSSNWSTPALESAVITAIIMSMVPAHLMRSVAGGYDNESIAMFAMTFTFYTWCRSLRGHPDSPNYLWAVISGLAYFYMVASWGGYVFVLNVIGVHASVLVLLGRYSTKLHRSYTIFYLLGTALAIRVPVVGWTPLKSLEQMGPLVAFAAFQLIEFCEYQRRLRRLSWKQVWILRIQVFATATVVAGLAAYTLAEAGYFGPISSRVRGLFVKHTKTGNPLVDSVAEHQPASSGAYMQYLDILVYLSPIGFGLVALLFFHDASSFLIVYGLAAYYFSAKMVRLILLTAPIASVLSGIALGHLWGWGITALLGYRPNLMHLIGMTDEETNPSSTGTSNTTTKTKSKNGNTSTINEPIVVEAETTTTAATKKGSKKKTDNDFDDDDALLSSATAMNNSGGSMTTTTENKEYLFVRAIRFIVFGYLVYQYKPDAMDFYNKCHELAAHLSHPTIIQKGRTHSGQEVFVDDYREAYWWLRDNTPQDARVMAWWDYGYQIAGIANRTTIADGNTWNHEHIALLGRALTSPLKDGHRIARHLADYLLLWTGGGGDDVAKSPHMRRIANSVYRFLCPGDPTCRSFGVTAQGQPTPAMRQSLLYQLHSHGLQNGIEADKNRFKLVKETRNGKVRIFKILSVSQESKEWVANPANRICDAPGSWFCRGQYPPALQKILKEKQDFAQLEDFNRGNKDSEYTKQYLDNLNDPEKAQRAAQAAERQSLGAEKKKKRKIQRLSQDEIDMMNNPEAWDDNAETTSVWEVIHKNQIKTFRDMLLENPELAHIRAKDGRGPMWWAHEYGRTDFVQLLSKLGVRDDLPDASGKTALSLSTISSSR